MEAYIGNFDKYLQVFLILMLLDYVSGIIAAIYNKQLNSEIGYKGIMKKFAIIICISVARQIDILDLYDSKILIRPLVLMFFTINEILSILENLTKTGIPVPEIMNHTLQKSREKKSNPINKIKKYK